MASSEYGSTVPFTSGSPARYLLIVPDVIATSNENGDYGHPDHINANRVAVGAFHAAGDPAQYAEQELEPWTPRKLYYAAWPRSGSCSVRFQCP